MVKNKMNRLKRLRRARRVIERAAKEDPRRSLGKPFEAFANVRKQQWRLDHLTPKAIIVLATDSQRKFKSLKTRRQRLVSFRMGRQRLAELQAKLGEARELTRERFWAAANAAVPTKHLSAHGRWGRALRKALEART